MRIKRSTILSLTLFIYLVSLTAYQRENSVFDQMLQIGSFVLLAVYYLYVPSKSRRGLVLSPISIWYLLFAVFGLGSALWAIYSKTDVFFYVRRMVQILGLYLVIPKFFSIRQDADRIDDFYKVIIAALVYAIILLFIRTPISAWGTERVGGAIGVDKNALGTRMAIGSIVSLYLYTKEKRKIYLIILAAMSAVVLLTGSKKAIFMLVVGISVYEIVGTESKKIKQIFERILLVACLFGLLWYLVFNTNVFYNTIGVRLNRTLMYFLSEGSTYDNSTRERQYYISVARDLFLQHPIIGVGLNNFKTHIAAIGYSHVAYSHNNYWELLSCLGITGAALYYWFHVKLLTKLIKNNTKRRKTYTLSIIVLVLYIICDYANVSYMNIFQHLMLYGIYRCSVDS